MALSNLTDLRNSLAGWLHRADVNGAASGTGVDNVVDDWIAMAEADFNADLRLRVMESDHILTTVANSRYIDLPEGFLEPVSLLLQINAQTDAYPLVFWPVQEIGFRVPATLPQRWTIDGEKIRFECPTSQAWTIYFRQVSKFQLTDESPTNWLLTNFPNVYLYGALMHSPGYVGVEERTSVWPNMYGAAKSALKRRIARDATLTTMTADAALLNRSRYGFNIYRGW